ncbi:DUF3179 domain-containing protein [Allopontixanthobacter sp.]|uniref:DUF3179 domain-containing protein n=1 Tax=Allopontixanthobacter sp. TaxID=2906452 RepID=UPI002AB9B852|nr:DUF3179 domain-containing protein [Allopontixanthobacter sp.]MDZ4306756.1 DUF3179 domain-containing protein [Allopontixanthobacter sp.]
MKVIPTGRTLGYVVAILTGLMLLLIPASQVSSQSAEKLNREFPQLDLSKSSVDLAEIKFGGVPRDAIPAILDANFLPVSEIKDLGDDEPVIFLTGQCGAYAFPYRVLIWHEIVHHDHCGVPVAVTYCPLCNTSMVFDRRVDGKILSFGTTGRLRHSDLVMYDHQTESFWQQFTGEAIVGTMTGTTLTAVPARIEAWRLFRDEFPQGQVLVPNDTTARDYGRNPYQGYDSAPAPFLYRGKLPRNIDPMARVVRVGPRAWSLDYVRRNSPVLTESGLRIEWIAGQNSALDSSRISNGRDIGNVRITRAQDDVAYSIDFAFAFFAFYPRGELIQ